MDAVISMEEACLLAIRQASFRRHELYSGSVTELGNLDIDARLLKATLLDSLAAKGKCTIRTT